MMYDCWNSSSSSYLNRHFGELLNWETSLILQQELKHQYYYNNNLSYFSRVLKQTSYKNAYCWFWRSVKKDSFLTSVAVFLYGTFGSSRTYFRLRFLLPRGKDWWKNRWCFGMSPPVRVARNLTLSEGKSDTRFKTATFNKLSADVFRYAERCDGR